MPTPPSSTRPDPAGSPVQPVSLQASPLLLCSLIAAAASTVALAVVAVIQANAAAMSQPDPPSQIAMIITAAIFVVAWIAVAFSFCRDQVLHRVASMEANVAAVASVQHHLRSDFAELRQELAEYAELRETDGFLNGRRTVKPTTAAGPPQPTAGPIRSLRRVPPLD
jgi:type III secretory pathway component EscR